jgi:hypothetical protein
LEAAAKSAWTAAGGWLTKYGNWQDERRKRSAGQKAGSGCLGFLLFGFIYFFIPIIVVLAVELVIVSWALIASALWGVGAAVDAVRGVRGRAPSVAASAGNPTFESRAQAVSSGECQNCGFENQSNPRRCARCATPL